MLGATRRLSFYFRYNSVPDTAASRSAFGQANAIYSGGGFTSTQNLSGDEGVYATATPAKNSGQGSVLIFGLNSIIPVNADIDSVKIVYERKYSTTDSIGISRVKIRVNGVEGPDHDNTDEPTTDTVVEVDVTADRVWERQDSLDTVFEVIVEARRGDSDTSHTQSWDYVKVEVGYHIPVRILGISSGGGVERIDLALTPRDSGVVLKFIDAAFTFYDGTTVLAVDTWYRISLGYVHNGIDDLNIKIYVNSVEELSLTAVDTGAADFLPDLAYGWLTVPGDNCINWFDQIYVDDGGDLSDPGNVLITAKLPAAVNENTWDTTGTGAVNERPVSFTNYRQQLGGPDRQTYTLQTAATGDINISGETLLGYMGWALAATSDFSEEAYLVLNNLEYAAPALNSLPGDSFNFLQQPITSASYPSHAAGIGMKSSPDGDTILLECGAVVAYEGPTEAALLPYQQLDESTVTDVSDTNDLGATYALRNEVDAAIDTVVTTTISSSTAEGEVPQQQAIIETRGGDEVGVTVVAPGAELSASVAVEGANANVELRRID